MEQQTYYMTSNNSSTFSSDFTSIQNDNTYRKHIRIDDSIVTITLENSFVFKNNSYNTIYLSDNGILGFNSTTTSWSPNIDISKDMICFFMPWSDIISTIYYKEDTVNKTFNVLFNSTYFQTTPIVQVELTLFLAGNTNSGNALFNFGSLTNNYSNSVFGFSFGSRNRVNLLTSVNLNTNNIFTSSDSPYLIITNTQSQLSNKQFLISTTAPSRIPTITNFSIPTKTIGDIPFTITPPDSNSSGSFTYTSSNTLVATISGNTLTIVGGGTTTITATQAATANYNSADIFATFQLNKLTPTITNFSIPQKTFGDIPFLITPPTSNSTGSFSYTSSNTSVATISGNTITIVGGGNTNIIATQAETANYTSGTITTSLQVNKLTPTITNFSIPTKTFGNIPFTLNPFISTFVNSGLSQPLGLAFDNSGNLYCANYNNTISKITSAGSVSTFVNSILSGPRFLAFDNSGNLYCNNFNDNTISKITSAGSVSTFVSGLSRPHGLAFDNSGNLYCTNFNNNTISKITSAGSVSTFVSGLSQPVGLAFDNSGNLYCTNLKNDTISKITSAGSVSTFVNSGLSQPYGLAFDNSGNLYCSNLNNNNISKITSAGSVSTFVNSGLSQPYGLAFDNSGNLYCTNLNNNTISKITLNTETPPPTSNSTGSFSYTSSNTSVATISGNTITIVGSGNTNIIATQAETANYTSGTITTSFQVNKLTPTITNFSIPTTTFGVIPFPITPPDSNSSGSFTYTSSNTLVATISGSTITTVGAGTSTITATQEASGNYLSEIVIFVYVVSLRIPTITEFIIQKKIHGDIGFPIYPPTSNSSGSFTYSSSDTSVATIYGSTITIVGSGSSIITATQAATTNYTSGTIETTFQVDQSTPTNPVIATGGDELLYFMNTTSIYCNIINSVEINEKLLASSYKVLNTTGDNVKITKTNN
jgi:streptogramin lyase